MEFDFFVQIVSAVIVGNAFFAAAVIAFLTMMRLEKQGVDGDNLPWWVYICCLIPLGMAAWGMSLITL